RVTIPRFFGRCASWTATPPSPMSLLTARSWPAPSFTWIVTGVSTAMGALRRKRLVEDEMGAEVSGVSQRGLGADNGHSHGPLIARSGAGAAQYARGGSRVCTVHDDCFKPSAGQFVNGGFGIGTKLHTDFQLTQYPPQDANDLLVGTKTQRL